MRPEQDGRTATPERLGAARVESGSALDGRGMTAAAPRPVILVVEDEAVAAATLADFLKRSGYDVVVAANGVEALRLFKKRGAAVLVTDIRMPEMDGLELVRRVRETEPRLPVVLMTGALDPDEAERAAEGLGDMVLMPKPLKLRELAARIAEFVARR